MHYYLSIYYINILMQDTLLCESVIYSNDKSLIYKINFIWNYICIAIILHLILLYFKQHISFCSAEEPLYTSYQKGDYTDLNPCINCVHVTLVMATHMLIEAGDCLAYDMY